jgi:hypothetical protein
MLGLGIVKGLTKGLQNLHIFMCGPSICQNWSITLYIHPLPIILLVSSYLVNKDLTSPMLFYKCQEPQTNQL